MKTVEIGRVGEKYAEKHLKKSRYKIVDKNVHASHNEIDIIARNKEFIVFVEVKARSVDTDLVLDYGSPASAVTEGKQQRTIRAAKSYLIGCKYSGLQPRFDVIEVYLDKKDKKMIKINHIENAFGIVRK